MNVSNFHMNYIKMTNFNRYVISSEVVWNLAGIGHWCIDLTTMTTQYDDEWVRIHESDTYDSFDEYIQLFQGQSKEQYKQALQMAMEQRKPFNLELEIITQNNTHKWIRIIGVPVLKNNQLIGIEGIIQEISSSRLKYKRSIIETLFELVPDSYFILDSEGVVRDFRVKETLVKDFHPELLLHKRIEEIIPGDVAEKFHHQMDIVTQQQSKGTFEFQLMLEDSVHHFECQLSLLADSKLFIAVLRDVTEQHSAKQAMIASEQRYQDLLQNAPFPVFMIRVRDGHLIYANKRGRVQFGMAEDELLNVFIKQFYQDSSDRERFLGALMRNGIVTDFEMPMLDFRGRSLWGLFSATIIEFNGEPTVLVSINDITERREAEEALRVSEENYRQLALFDELTGAPNKNHFKLEAEKLIVNPSTQYAFVALDVAHFKFVNDLFGFDKGDALLQYMANVLSCYIQENEIFARAEADKFYLLLQYKTIEQLDERLHILFKKITNHQIRIDSKYHLIINAGIYVINESDTNLTINHMIDRANLALRKMKDSHESSFYIYNDTIRNKLMMKRELENDMNMALENHEFKVFVQPKYNLQTQEIVGGEALVRWQHPTKGMISPFDFISVFEQNGFITKLDMYILEAVCQKQQQWIAQGHVPQVIAINQSKLHFFNPHYIDELKNILTKYQIEPSLIELEFTESAVFDNIDSLLDVMKQLRELGFKLSIDDFGTGYSSLNMLKDVEVDTLKLDRGFIIDTANEVRRKIIIQAVIDMAKTLSMTVVAEGIETKEQEDLLCDMGCDTGQGYFFAKPMPIEEFYKLLYVGYCSLPR